MMEELIYNIFTFIIIAFAVFVAGKKIYDSVKPKNDSSSCSSGCGGCGTPCELKDVIQNSKINP